MTTAVVSQVSLAPVDRLDTLPPFPMDGSVLTLGPYAANWTSQWLRQPNGPNVGRAFEFTPRQLRFLFWWYAVDDDGEWLFNHGARRLAKGSGKSPFAAVLALVDFCAPVRVSDIDHRRRRVLGKPVDMPWVQIAATAESQTANTMRMVRAFASKDSDVVRAHLLDPGKTKYYKLPEGTLEVITGSATAAEGAEGSLVVADETEHWRPGNGGVELAATLEDNLAKSGSRMLETANSWVPGTDCVAEGTWDAWVAQEEGRTRGQQRILYDAVIAPGDTDLADPVSLQRALEWVYADCPWVNIRTIMERIWSPKSRPDDSRRKYLNRPTVAEDAWVKPEQWALLADPARVVADGEDIVLFFDGSKSRDATALIGCRVSDGHVFTVGIWEPDPGHDTASQVPVVEVDLAVRAAADRYTVLGFFADVQEFESFTKVEWPDLFPDLVIKAVPSGKNPEPIAWDMRSHVFEFTKAAELCSAEIVECKFTHDGDSRLARHVANMRRRPNRHGVSVGKESPSSPNKIDAGVCVIGVRHARRMVLASPKLNRKRSGRVWF